MLAILIMTRVYVLAAALAAEAPAAFGRLPLRFSVALVTVFSISFHRLTFLERSYFFDVANVSC